MFHESVIAFIIGIVISCLWWVYYHNMRIKQVVKHYADLAKEEIADVTLKSWRDDDRQLEENRMLRLSNSALEQSNRKYKKKFDILNEQTKVMPLNEALQNMDTITEGILRTHMHDGWWPDSTGLALGMRVHHQLRKLITTIYFSNFKEKEND